MWKSPPKCCRRGSVLCSFLTFAWFCVREKTLDNTDFFLSDDVSIKRVQYFYSWWMIHWLIISAWLLAACISSIFVHSALFSVLAARGTPHLHLVHDLFARLLVRPHVPVQPRHKKKKRHPYRNPPPADHRIQEWKPRWGRREHKKKKN